MNSGKITPVVTGLQHPNGLAFAPTAVAYVPAKIKK
jgi:hypothetical protein